MQDGGSPAAVQPPCAKAHLLGRLVVVQGLILYKQRVLRRHDLRVDSRGSQPQPSPCHHSILKRRAGMHQPLTSYHWPVAKACSGRQEKHKEVRFGQG